MKLVIGTDHRGFNIKQYLVSLKKIGLHEISWLDIGTDNEERVDYPLYAERAANSLLKNEVNGGVLLCGTGVGMSIATNRFDGIYAALVWNENVASRAKKEDGANILVLPADYLDNARAVSLIQSWLDADFLGGHYQDRLNQIDSFK